MKPLSAAVVESGLISPNKLAEMRRFSPSVGTPVVAGEPVPLEDAAASLSKVVQEADYVAVRETDLDAVQVYLKSQKEGMLHIEMISADDKTTADFPVTYGRTKMGEYIIPWSTPTIADAMTNGFTHLTVKVEGGEELVYFDDVRELYFDDTKAFMVCRSAVLA
jgi:hypothetical protein